MIEYWFAFHEEGRAISLLVIELTRGAEEDETKQNYLQNNVRVQRQALAIQASERFAALLSPH